MDRAASLSTGDELSLSSASTVNVCTLDPFHSNTGRRLPESTESDLVLSDVPERIRWNGGRIKPSAQSCSALHSRASIEAVDIPRRPRRTRSRHKQSDSHDERPLPKYETSPSSLVPVRTVSRHAGLLNPLDLEVNEKARVPSMSGGEDTFRARHALEWPPNLYSACNSHTSFVTLKEDYEPSEKHGGYVIQRLAKHDDMESMPKWKRTWYRLSPLPVALSFIVYWIYFGMRVYFTVDASRTNKRSYWIAWCFVTVELIVAIPMFLQRVWCLHATGLRKRPKLRLIGDNVPSVDVFITSCKEDEQLILDTALAACNIDYPRHRFRVLVCDDGKSQKLKAMVEQTARYHFPNLYYRSRPKYPGVPHHFKAGNLNDALQVTQNFEGGPGDFIAALDADMIPSRDWLRALLPHLVQDYRCSMACPPQLFYNVPLDDPLCQSLDGFCHAVEPIKDTLGVAWCTGSGYAIRRSALDAIGGFPVGSLGEDVFCSSMLLGAGWNTAFVHEPLQYGTVPEDLPSHLKQRTRWTIGTIQTSIKLNFCLFGKLASAMTAYQRICGCIYTICAIITVFVTISLILVPIILISGRVMIPYSNIDQLKWLIRIVFCSMVLNRLNEGLSFLPSGYRKGQRDVRMLFWMAPFHAIAVVRTFVLPKWLGGKIAVFTSTGSQDSALNERDPKHRAPLWRRLKVTIWDCQCYIHAIYVPFVIASVVVSSYKIFSDPGNNSTEKKLIAFVTHAGWPPVMWLMYVFAMFEPLRYAIFPPSVPDREDLLQRDPKTSVAYPTEEAKIQRQSWITLIHEVQYTFLSIYTTVVFVWSFFI